MSSPPKAPDVQESGYGFKIPNQFSLEAFRSALEYKPRPDDIFIVTYPKCGTTWVQNIVACIFREGKPFDSALDFFVDAPFLEMTGAEGAITMKRPGAIKLHLPFRLVPWSTQAKYIYVARNPKDVCVSFFNHVKNMKGYNFTDGKFDDYFELFLSGKVTFGDYFDHLLSWYEHRDEPNVLFITYEYLQTNITAGVMQIAEFMGQKYKDMLENNSSLLSDVIEKSSFQFMKNNLSRQVAKLAVSRHDAVASRPDIPKGLKAFLESKHNLFSTDADSVSFVRKGIVGDWKNYFSPEQSKRMDAKFRERTKGTDIPEFWKGII